MKYIISESRLERLVITYLSSLDFKEDYYDADDVSVLIGDGFDIIHNGDRAMGYRSRDKKLYISTDLIDDIKSLFDLSQREVMNYVRMWFQDEYNVEVKTLWLLFPDEPFTY
jgi:hypothetical protein